MQRLREVPNPEAALPAMFAIFERFPEEDGFGVFWSILHAAEGLAGFESALVESVESRPSEFSLTMVNRLLNAGVSRVEGQDLLALLVAAVNTAPSPRLRALAKRFVDYQLSHGA